MLARTDCSRYLFYHSTLHVTRHDSMCLLLRLGIFCIFTTNSVLSFSS